MTASTLEDRLTELETRLAFQEHALSELSDALALSRTESAQVAAQLLRVLDELAHSRGGLVGDAADEPPPPHY